MRFQIHDRDIDCISPFSLLDADVHKIAWLIHVSLLNINPDSPCRIVPLMISSTDMY